MKEAEGNDDHEDDCPEVYQLNGKNRGVAVGEDEEIISLHVKKGEDDVCRSIRMYISC